MPAVDPLPKNYPRMTPYVVLEDCADAIEFYKTVLGATERMRLPGPDGTVGHSELVLGDALLMVADGGPGIEARTAKELGGSPLAMFVYVEDVDAVVAAAVEHGATLEEPVETKFYGDRAGTVQDPFGLRWSIVSHVEDVSPEEMERRAAALAEATSGAAG